MLQHAAGRVITQQQEYVDATCLVSTGQAGRGVMMWGLFS